MRVKNVSKKVIGNQSFRILPGESMDVNGDELWVKMYLADGKLVEEKAGPEDVEIPTDKASGDVADAESNGNQEEGGALPDSEAEDKDVALPDSEAEDKDVALPDSEAEDKGGAVVEKKTGRGKRKATE